eukprot:468112-Prorocentrum_minimum.AAC.1
MPANSHQTATKPNPSQLREQVDATRSSLQCLSRDECAGSASYIVILYDTTRKRPHSGKRQA